MNANDDRVRLDRFLRGELRDTELESFLQQVRSGDALRQELAVESALEGALYVQSWGTADDMQTAAWVIDTQDEKTEETCRATGSVRWTEEQWADLVDCVLDHAVRSDFERTRKKRIRLQGRTAWSCLLAACLIAALGVTPLLVKRRDVPDTVAGSIGRTDLELSGRQLGNADSGAAQFPLAADVSTRTYKSSDLRDRPVRLDSDHQGVIRFGEKTIALAKPSTVLKVREELDSVVVLELTAGEACFEVEKGRYRRFVVVTPTARITVTGTVFRVVVGDGYTTVGVEQGSVEVTQVPGEIERRVVAGECVVSNSDSILEVVADRIGARAMRRNLLDALIRSSGPGPFDVVAQSDSATVQYREARTAIAADDESAELALLRRRMGKHAEADSLLLQYLATAGDPCCHDELLYETARDYVRLEGHDRALFWFELLVELCPYSRFRADAAHGASLCVVEQSIGKRGKRALSFREKLGPTSRSSDTAAAAP